MPVVVANLFETMQLFVALSFLGSIEVSSAMGKRWLPLESNPDVLNDFVQKLGYSTKSYAFCDVFGLDEVRTMV